MIFREAKREDARAIARVHVDSWRSTYRGIMPETVLTNLSLEKRQSSWNEMISTAAIENHFIYVAVSESGEIVGFASGGREKSGNSIYKGELYAIYLLESHQRQGIGRKLIQLIVQRLAEIKINSVLVLVLANNPSCQFYLNIGGQKMYEKEIARGGLKLKEIAYVWQDTREIFQLDRL